MKARLTRGNIVRFAALAAATTLAISGLSAVAAAPAHASTSGSAIVAIAQRELNDSTRNYEVGNNCSFYGGFEFGWPACGGMPGWGGGGDGYAWCAAFARYVWQQAGVTTDLGQITGMAASFRSYGQNHGTWHARGSYTPQPGDAVVFDWLSNGVGVIDHVGIVTSTSGGTLYTIEGNASDRTEANSYSSYASDVEIVGFTTAADVTVRVVQTGSDLNGDGKSDLIATTSSGSASAYLGTGKVGFNTAFGSGINIGNWSNLTTKALGDLNGDGYPDLVARATDGYGYAYLGTGSVGLNTTFTSAIQLGNWSNIAAFGLADLNGDGKADLVAKGTDGYGYAYLGTGNVGYNTAFGSAIQLGNWSNLTQLQFGDLNGDGKADLVAKGTDGYGYAYLGTGAVGYNSAFGSGIQLGNWSGLTDYALADINGDGKVDLVGKGTDGYGYGYLGTGNVGFNTAFGSAIQLGNWSGLTDIVM